MDLSNRADAGRMLGERLMEYAERRPIVVAMPRGGVPVAAEVAQALTAPLDIVVVRKIGAPRQPEFALGAVAEGGVELVNRSAQRSTAVSDEELAVLVAAARAELERRAAIYRSVCPPLDLDGRNAILVDDGLATGSTAAAAARSLRGRGIAEVVLAVPVCAAECVDRPPDRSISKVVSLLAPEAFFGVGMWYREFAQVTDAEVLAILQSVHAHAHR